MFEYSDIRKQLVERRARLKDIMQHDYKNASYLVNLLQEVDSALERINDGTYGICEECNEPIEEDRLRIDPLIRFCLDHLNSAQQHHLEQDLELASQIQKMLLPKDSVALGGWEINYHYEPAGPVSGDYCDLIKSTNGNKELYFILGDVSGKGVSASMLMMHMHAMFHSLIELDVPVDELMRRVNRLLCESSISTHYITLVCGKINERGDVEICNAGHFPPLALIGNEIVELPANGLPLGLFANQEYEVTSLKLNPGEKIFIYTDGVLEARNNEIEYGNERLKGVIQRFFYSSPEQIIKECLNDLTSFLSGNPKADDLTMMIIKRK